MPKNPFLFVVGCARSGTTLLQRMLDSHPQLAVSNDPHFIPFAVQGVLDGVDPPVTPELVDSVLDYRTFIRLGLPEAAVREAAAGAERYSDFVGAIYSAFARMRGKPLGGEKTPRYVRYLPLLASLFPWAKIVHIIRDGRDVALSMLDWARPDRGPGRFQLWQDRPVAVCALSWRWHVTTGRRDGIRLGRDRYHEVRYEDLVAKPEEALRRIAHFLELDFAPEMLRYHEGKERSDPGLSTKGRWLPPTLGLRDWRVQMAPGEVELYEAIAGDVLTLFGYESAFDSISEATESLARLCRESWEADLHRREKRMASRLELRIELPSYPAA